MYLRTAVYIWSIPGTIFRAGIIFRHSTVELGHFLDSGLKWTVRRGESGRTFLALKKTINAKFNRKFMVIDL